MITAYFSLAENKFRSAILVGSQEVSTPAQIWPKQCKSVNLSVSPVFILYSWWGEWQWWWWWWDGHGHDVDDDDDDAGVVMMMVMVVMMMMMMWWWRRWGWWWWWQLHWWWGGGSYFICIFAQKNECGKRVRIGSVLQETYAALVQISWIL